MGIYQGSKLMSGGGGGPSPYEIAKQNGYTGTEQAFNQLLAALDQNATEQDLNNKADLVNGKVPAEQVDAYTKTETNTLLQNKADTSSVYTKDESISASTRTALSLAETATPDAALAEIARQLPGTVESTDYPGCYYRMVDGVTEWVNPPMILGVEYRTTDRYLGKPVYIRTLDFGALPNNTMKDISLGYVDGVIMPLSVEGHFYRGPDRHSIPWEYSGKSVKFANFNPNSVTIVTNYNLSGFENCHVVIKFTKDTD